MCWWYGKEGCNVLLKVGVVLWPPGLPWSVVEDSGNEAGWAWFIVNVSSALAVIACDAFWGIMIIV